MSSWEIIIIFDFNTKGSVGGLSCQDMLHGFFKGNHAVVYSEISAHSTPARVSFLKEPHSLMDCSQIYTGTMTNQSQGMLIRGCSSPPKLETIKLL